VTIKRVLLAAVIGVAVTLLLIAASFAADDAGHETLSNVLFWQNWLLQALMPAPNIGSAEHPFAEGTPLTFIVWFASVPLGFVIYGVAAFAVIRRLRLLKRLREQ
jgi:UPF0716 family protein affecting phage T7 exclusion